MLTTTKGPGDEITWPSDPAGVSVCADDIQAVVARRVGIDPVGRDWDRIMELMVEETPIDGPDAEDEALVYLAKHMDDAGFPPALRASLTAAFTSIAEQTDVADELARRRSAQKILTEEAS